MPHAFGPAESSRNRPQGRLLSFVARDVPGLGYRRFALVEDAAPQAHEAGAFENEHYRMELEVESGHSVRLLDLELRLDLVDAASAFGFGQVVRDLYGGPLQATRRVTSGTPVTDAEAQGSGALITARHTPRDGVVGERVSNPVEERIAPTRADGFELIEASFRLLRGIRRLDVSVRLVKHATTEKESVHVVFPFGARDPAIAYELTGGVGGGPPCPGRRGTCRQSDTGSRSRAPTQPSRGARCRHRSSSSGTLLPYPPYPETVDGAGPGMVTSWVMNNVWGDELPARAGRRGAVRLRRRLGGPDRRRPRTGIATADALTRPLVGVLGATATALTGATGTVCEVEAPGVQVVMLAPSDDGVAVHLQSMHPPRSASVWQGERFASLRATTS